MGRTYAGILGSLAFLLIVARGLIQRGGLETTMQAAVMGLIVFALVGLFVGQVAQWTVDEAVRGKLAAEIEAQQKESRPTTAKS